MKNKAGLFGLYLPIYIFFTLAACAFRTAALLLNFDFDSGYFNEKLLIGIANILAVLGVIILLTFIINGKKNMKLIPEFSNGPTLFASVTVIGSLVFLCVYALRRLAALISDNGLASHNGKIGIATLFLVFCFGIVCIAYLALNLLLGKHRIRARANLGIPSLFFFASYAAYLYFNTALPLNAPNKLVDEMAYLFLAVFFLYETRLALGRARWRGYIAFGLVGGLLCAYSAIPSIIYYMVEKSSPSDSIYESVLTLSLLIFLTVRTLMTGELIIDKTSPKMQLIIEAAEERSLSVKSSVYEDKSVREDAEVENQIALSDVADIDRTPEDIRRAEEEEAKKQELIEKLEKLSTQEDG